jgi:hypothetical protein
MKVLKEYNREWILRMIADVKEIESASNDVIDLIIGRKACSASSTEMYTDYIKNLNVWYYFLKNAVLEEDYEMAEEIRKILLTEEKNFHRIIYTYCMWFNRKRDKQLIKEITEEFKEVYDI